MNISELARRLKISTQELRQIIPLLGFDVGMRAIKVDQKVAQEILNTLSNPEVLQGYLQKILPQERVLEPQGSPVPLEEGVLQIPQTLTVRQFAELIHQPVTKVILLLMRNGIMAAQNERIDFETASILAQDLGYKTVKAPQTLAAIEETLDVKKELEKAMNGKQVHPRPPVVVVMGHVDHGKTTLLDAIRQAHVVDREAGGITQHIGAYQVMVSPKDESSSRVSEANRGIPRQALDDVATQERTITFIDTPGHEAFTAMRSRGAKIADVAILVVAADDGVQPQTIEALSHIQRAELPFLVAINKMDKEEANPERVMKELSEVGVVPEEWGGKIPFVKISARKGEGIHQLLEVILLVSDLQRESIIADYQGSALGSIIEAHMDKGEGPVATVLVQNGMLLVGDLVVVGNVFGKVKAMRTDSGKSITKALPSTPVRVLGLKDLPKVGDLLKTTSEEEWKQTVRGFKKTEQRGLPSFLSQQTKEASIPKISLVLKADVLGSIEALKEALETVEKQGALVVFHHKGLGVITETDVEQALATGSTILGFNVQAAKDAEVLAKEKNISIITSKIIYDLVDVVNKKADELLGPRLITKELGTALIKVVFRQDKKSAVIGCAVVKGIIRTEGKILVRRNGEQIGESKIMGLQSQKLPIQEAAEGSECGIKLKLSTPLQANDELVYVIEEARQRK